MQTQNITLDFCLNDYKTVTVKQGDKDSRNLIITCTDNGSVYKLNSSSQECNVKMNTPDNRAIFNTATINSDGTISMTFTESMVYANGTGKLEIQIIEQSTKRILSTMILTVVIVGNVYPDDKVIASDEFSALTEALLSINDSINEAEKAIDRIEVLESTVERAEVNRINAESERQSNEENRQTNTATAIANAEEATAAANTATTNANNATETANTATENAIEATSNAVNATANANEAAENAIDATQNAIQATNDIRSLEEQVTAAETLRQEQEAIRQENEEKRQTDTTTAINNANTATVRANEAANAAEAAAANFEADDTLSQSGKAADAAVVGEKFSQLSGEIVEIDGDVESILNIQILDENWSSFIGGNVADYPTRIKVAIDNVKAGTIVTFGKLLDLTYGNLYYWRYEESNSLGGTLSSQSEWAENTVNNKYVVQHDCNLVLEFRYPSSSVDVSEESTWQPIKSALRISYSKNISDIVDLIDSVAVNVTDYVGLPYDLNSGYRWNGSAVLTASSNYDAISIPVTDVKMVEITGELSSATRSFYMYSDGTKKEIKQYGNYSNSEPLILTIPINCNELRLTLVKSIAYSIKNMGDKFTYKASKQSDMDNMMLKIGNLENEILRIMPEEIPEYWTEQIENKVAEINTIINNASADYNDVSVFFTQADPHYPSNTGMATVLMQELSKRCGISLLLNLGDVIQDSTTSHAENLKRIQEAMDRMIKGTDRLLLCQGNHDNGVGIKDGSGNISAERIVYDTEWVLHTSNKLQVIPNIVFEPNTRKAFYYDDEVLKIRFVSIDFFENDVYTIDGNNNVTVTLGSPSEEQLLWLRNSAFANVPTDYSIVTFGHLAIFSATVSNGTTDIDIGVGYKPVAGEEIVEMINDYKNNGGAFIGHFCGHLHHDFVTTKNGITCVQSLNDGTHWREASYFGDLADYVGDAPLKTAGTITECAFDVVIVNKTTRHVDLVRIGVGNNRSYTY